MRTRVTRVELDRMLGNTEVKALIVALGMGIGEVKDVSKLRYHRVVIMTDADVDGAHIRTLLLTLFYRYFPELFDGGYLYIAQPPLYKIQKDKDIRYVYTDQEKAALMKEWGIGDEETRVNDDEEAPVETADDALVADSKKDKAAPRKRKINIQRYKGLGEMNPEQLWETTMDPENRIMLKVTSDDAEKANAVFTTLMGSEVAPRRKFIQTHAKTVTNLDI